MRFWIAFGMWSAEMKVVDYKLKVGDKAAGLLLLASSRLIS